MKNLRRKSANKPNEPQIGKKRRKSRCINEISNEPKKRQKTSDEVENEEIENKLQIKNQIVKEILSIEKNVWQFQKLPLINNIKEEIEMVKSIDLKGKEVVEYLKYNLDKIEMYEKRKEFKNLAS